MNPLVTIRLPDTVQFDYARAWCKNHCTGKFYHGRDWDNWDFGKENKTIQFESEQDAVLFSLSVL